MSHCKNIGNTGTSFAEKKFLSLEEFFANSDKILTQTANECSNPKEAIMYIRTNFKKDILNACYDIGRFDDNIVNLLGAKTSLIKFSTDSLLKNRINHPDLCFGDYKKINDIITNPDEVKLSKNKRNSVLLLKKDGKRYQVVVKTTFRREENFLTSFRLAEH